jgi:tRNA pseudouridine13 synthase
MKLKQQPEDFQVEELTDVACGPDGPFAFYRLEKRGWTTHDALRVIQRRWRLDRRRLAYGGLKDRHAHTVQYFTVFHGPRRKLAQQGIQVQYLGQLTHPYTSRDIRANHFQIALRALSPSEATQALQGLAEVHAQGVPNYFDDQRFGSVGPDGTFVAGLIVRGRHEEALRTALTACYEHDRAAQRREKAIVRACWGNWLLCKEELPRGHARSLVDYLVSHPDDFRGALARLRPDLRSLYLSAYQSHLWNRMLAHWLEEYGAQSDLLSVRLRLGDVPMHRAVPPETYDKLVRLRLPLPSARVRSEATESGAQLVSRVLAEEGIGAAELKLKGFRDMFFSKGYRATLFHPKNLVHELDDDDRHPGQEKLTLHFDLPTGSYATLLVKRITAAGPRSSLSRPGPPIRSAALDQGQ